MSKEHVRSRKLSGGEFQAFGPAVKKAEKTNIKCWRCSTNSC